MTASEVSDWLEQDVRPWIVCEPGDRWVTAVRRFASEMMHPWIPSIHPSQPEHTIPFLTKQQVKESSSRRLSSRQLEPQIGAQAVILWEVQKTMLLETCGHLPSLRVGHPDALLIFAVTDLSNEEVRILAEFGFAMMLRHPEELPKLRGLIQGYFATSVQDLD